MITMPKVRICVFTAVMFLILVFVGPLSAHTHPDGCAHKHISGQTAARFTKCTPYNGPCKIAGCSGKCKDTWGGCTCFAEKKSVTAGTIDCVAEPPLLVNTPQTFTVIGGMTTLYFPENKQADCGEQVDLPPPDGGIVTLLIDDTEPGGIAYWEILELDMTIPSYEMCGQMTGLNVVTLDPNVPSTGEMDLATGEMDGRLFLHVVNDLYTEFPIEQELWLDGNVIENGMLELHLYYTGNALIPPCCGKPFLEGDVNEDCFVNLYDVEILANGWIYDLCL